ncbi:MAG: undecaprenyl-diphosphatase, partial [Intrasporangiaceae bacterium]|nr:undecaprenyl-diphosphatase [Intrasporangiaceae bacterium]
MSWLEAIILGIVQGLTEFLPVSSSAHLLVVGQLFFDGRDPGAAFTAVTQIGTEMAVIVYFARDIGRIIRKWFLALARKVPQSDPDVRMGWMVIVGSLPIAVLGLVFEDAIDAGLRNLWITAAMLAGVGLVLLAADRMARNERTLDRLTWKDAVLLGLAQAAALIPGVSRSGATISAGLLLGFRRE